MWLGCVCVCVCVSAGHVGGRTKKVLLPAKHTHIKCTMYLRTLVSDGLITPNTVAHPHNIVIR